MQFKDLKIIPEILKALEKESYIEPTEIQEQAIPPILEGRDLLGCAQTGTGKTAAFAVPTLQLLSLKSVEKTARRKIRSLILTPTRELAVQISESFSTYGRYTNLRCCVIFGGVSQKPQEKMLENGVDILVATPGRLNDLINQGFVNLNDIEIFILDEADRMLDMGFIHDVKKIIAKTPTKKQTLLFSATMPPEISEMVNSLLINPVKVAITPVSSTVDTISQSLYFVDKCNKSKLLLHILKDKSLESVLVFTRTKHGADRLARELEKENIVAQAIHGDKSQTGRQMALKNFKSKITRVLVATDIAARGIDIDELSCVVNFELPNVPETYVHRIGRTGRAGLSGIAISFCDFEEKSLLKDIEKLINKQVPVVKEHPFPMVIMEIVPKNTNPRNKSPKAPTETKEAKSHFSDRRQHALANIKGDAPKRYSSDKTGASKKAYVPKRKERDNGEISKKPASSDRNASAKKNFAKPKSKKPYFRKG